MITEMSEKRRNGIKIPFVEFLLMITKPEKL